MSSGRDVWMESWNNEMTKREKVNEMVGNKLDTPHLVTYYCRVNGDKITWGYMKQLDDNLVITYNKDNKTFNINKI